MKEQKVKLAYRKFVCPLCKDVVVRLSNVKTIKSMCDKSGYADAILKEIK